MAVIVGEQDVTEPETPAEIREALGNLSHAAKRCIPAVGSQAYPTKWDVAHQRIDDMLTLLELAG